LPKLRLEAENTTTGSRLVMVKVRALDVPPPGEGFSTVTEAVPAVAMSLAGTVAVNCVLLA
jgi:hypothetical protein